MKRDCAAKLANISQTPQYTALLKQLIIQGLIKIEEPVVQLMCRTEDKALVRGVVSDAVKEYKTLMTNAGHKVNPQVTVSDVAIPSKTWSVTIICFTDIIVALVVLS